MSFEVLAEQQRLQQTTSLFNAELLSKYSKYIKTIGKRVVEGLSYSLTMICASSVSVFQRNFVGFRHIHVKVFAYE